MFYCCLFNYQRHQQELRHKSHSWADGLLEHLPDNVQVKLTAHVDRVDDDHDGHDKCEELIEGLVLDQDEDLNLVQLLPHI